MTITPSFNFNDLFILDLANNHQGDVEHGIRIIREMGEVVRANGVRAALKFQFRQLDTFIHPSHDETSDNKHIPRFLSTQLSRSDFDKLLEAVREEGFVSMATPFDEGSVDQIVDQDIEVVKVASCSATDWPLLESVADCNKPVVFSTGGLTWKQLDDVVSCFDHRSVSFAIMHCVSIYPTPHDQLQLNQIELIRQRYPNRVVGFSTHEPPDSLAPVHVAVAKGAEILERHVGVETDSIQLNQYSSTPDQLDQWIKAALDARAMCGQSDRLSTTSTELDALASLARGVFARTSIKKGTRIERSNVYFAMPRGDKHLASGKWRDGIVATQGFEKDSPISLDSVTIPSHPDKQIILTAIHEIKAMLNEARISLPPAFETEFSHHYGIPQFREFGAILITCVNRSYCKKLIIVLSGQHHPNHYHKSKEETFMVLSGVLELAVEGRRRTLYPGDTLLVQQGTWHEFWSENGAVFEEISTADVVNDSFYEDKAINSVTRESRKTRVNQWGRYQL